MQTTEISTTATRATRTPMTAPSAVLLILVVLSSCEVIVGDTLSIVVVVEVVVVDTLSTVVVIIKVVTGVDASSINVVVLMSLPLVAAVASDCVTVTTFRACSVSYYCLLYCHFDLVYLLVDT